MYLVWHYRDVQHFPQMMARYQIKNMVASKAIHLMPGLKHIPRKKACFFTWNVPNPRTETSR